MKPSAKEDLEISINSAPLFTIDKQSAPALYEKEVNILIGNLYRYCGSFCRMSNAPRNWLDDFGLEFLEICRNCINAFNPDTGDFLPYFLSSLYRRYRTVKGRESAAERHGHMFSNNAEKNIYKLIRFANKKGIDLDDPAVVKKISVIAKQSPEKEAETIAKWSPEKMAALLKMKETVAVASTVSDDEGEERSIFDLIADKQAGAEAIVDQEESLQELLRQCERAFLSLQERSRRAISMVLTAELLRVFKGNPKRVRALLAGRKFLSREVLKRYFAVVKEFETTKDSAKFVQWSLTRREIASLCGISEQSLSATWNNTFLTKLKKVREEELRNR